jgi:hypothetical protein
MRNISWSAGLLVATVGLMRALPAAARSFRVQCQAHHHSPGLCQQQCSPRTSPRHAAPPAILRQRVSMARQAPARRRRWILDHGGRYANVHFLRPSVRHRGHRQRSAGRNTRTSSMHPTRARTTAGRSGHDRPGIIHLQRRHRPGARLDSAAPSTAMSIHARPWTSA